MERCCATSVPLVVSFRPRQRALPFAAVRHSVRGNVLHMLQVIVSTSAAARLAAATEFLSKQPKAAEVAIIGASRGAADDLARAVARRAGATFGIARFSLTQLAA